LTSRTLTALVLLSVSALAGGSPSSALAPKLAAGLAAKRITPAQSCPSTAKLELAVEGYGIYVISADGSGRRQVTKATRFNGSNPYGHHPVWSPDGQRIAFDNSEAERELISDIYVVNRDGTGLRRLTRDTHSEIPHWSPDGKQILYTRQTSRGEHTYTMNADGSNQHRLSRDLPKWFSWSPDGQRIAFAEQGNIVVTNVDLSGRKVLTHARDAGDNPSWSPDGRKIAFIGGGFAPGVFVVDANGTRRHRVWKILTDAVGGVAWSPDGALIAVDFNNYETAYNTWVIRPDGSGLHKVTHRGGATPQWRPCTPRA
jgi:Tol biopolymer transport system component